MLFKWLDTTEVTQAGIALADDFNLRTASSRADPLCPGRDRTQGRELHSFLQKFLKQVDSVVHPLKLNAFKRAKLANSFKWRLLDKGVKAELADDLTQALVMRLMAADTVTAAAGGVSSSTGRRNAVREAQALHLAASEQIDKGAFAEARESYQQLVNLDPRDAAARNGLGIALSQLARYAEAEGEFRHAIGIRPGHPEVHYNLAQVLLSTGRFNESEVPLRRALKLKPSYVDARISLGTTCLLLRRLPEARECYEKALRAAPRDTRAMVGMGQIASLEGKFADAEAAFRRALEIDPRESFAWAALVSLRKQIPADADWVKRAEEIADGGLNRVDEAMLRFAIGKYYDDVGDFAQAFRSYRRANELHKLCAEPYDRQGYTRFIDAVISARTPEAIASASATGSDSERPVFVLGMPRSGTSLVEQIIASHPAAHGAGEIDFWQTVVRRNAADFWKSLPGEPERRKLARDYLEILTGHSANALRVVDKTPINANYLGIIHTTFPKAPIIFVQRDPIDTCLSCYFQQFPPALNWSMDLGDLAHYYRESQRVAAHWHRVLPPGTVLDVPYEELVSDQEKWTRRIIEFIGLSWDDRCVDFHKTTRAVITASNWQVRQELYMSSVGRWRHYEKFIGPLRSLADLTP